MKNEQLIRKLNPTLDKDIEQFNVYGYVNISPSNFLGYYLENKNAKIYFDDETFDKVLTLVKEIVNQYSKEPYNEENLKMKERGLSYKISDEYEVEITRRSSNARLGRNSISTTVCLYYPNDNYGPTHKPAKSWYDRSTDKYYTSFADDNSPFEVNENVSEKYGHTDVKKAVVELIDTVDYKLNEVKREPTFFDGYAEPYDKESLLTFDEAVEKYDKLFPSKHSQKYKEKQLNKLDDYYPKPDSEDLIDALLKKKYISLYGIAGPGSNQKTYMSELLTTALRKRVVDIDKELETRIKNNSFDKTCKDEDELEKKSDLFKKGCIMSLENFSSRNRKYIPEEELSKAEQSVEEYRDREDNVKTNTIER